MRKKKVSIRVLCPKGPKSKSAGGNSKEERRVLKIDREAGSSATRELNQVERCRGSRAGKRRCREPCKVPRKGALTTIQ